MPNDPVGAADPGHGQNSAVLLDRTRYGSTRISTKSYFVHHTQRITKAAVMYDAKAILKQVVVLKQRCLRTGTATHAATAGGGA